MRRTGPETRIVRLMAPSSDNGSHGLRHAGTVIFPAFGRDVVGAILCAGAVAFGHHRAALGVVVVRRVGVGCGHAANGVTQAGKQQRAARSGDIGLPRR